MPASPPSALAAKALLTGGADGECTTAVAGLAPVAMRLSDGPNGVDGRRYDERDPSACTPCGSALAATWDVELVTRVGDLIGREATAKGVHVVLAPVLNLARSPLGGRAFESFGEEPFLVPRRPVPPHPASMATAAVQIEACARLGTRRTAKLRRR